VNLLDDVQLALTVVLVLLVLLLALTIAGVLPSW